MMDMMQMNIKKEQSDFLLEKCVCMVDAEAGFCGKPVFFIWTVENFKKNPIFS